MKTAAIIAEYNPLHLGHAWQLAAIRRQLGSSCAVLAVMSGNFTQRGEPAVLDKWSRTRMALACGVDLVLELPFAYAAASAERFAAGGVQSLQATGLDCQLVFGSESGDLDRLDRLAGILATEDPAWQDLLRGFLDQGESFPAARQQAVAAYTHDPDLASLLESANNILAVEYLKAIRRLPACRLQPLTLPRQGQAYRDSEPAGPSGGFASASAIRRRLELYLTAGRSDPGPLVQDLAAMMPAPSLAILLEQLQAGPGPLRLEDLAVPILAQLRSQPVQFIEQVPGMGEGLGRRLAAAAARPTAADNGRLAGLLADVATRRFPQTRIQRALIALLAGLTAEDYALFDRSGGPPYLRVLGFNRQGRYLLKVMRRLAERPIIMKASDFLEYRDPAFCRLAELDILATDLWMLAAGQPCGRDFDTPVVMG